jgi:TRAP-type C4-dicarboxylate transport system permease small subunit
VVVAGLIVSVLLQVISRYALGNHLSLAWTDEVARSLVAWLTFLGAVLLDRDGEHIHVTIVVDLLGDKARTVVGVLTDMMCLAYLALVLVSAIGSVEADAYSTMVSIPIPMAVVTSSLAIGAVLMIVHVTARLCGRITGLLRGRRA